ncbi:uncharacterized protein [Parasteatoda tepidariorum]|uniref:uncharacterized protein n=1 Tax=Parasteatoda tepidariorum TaxID=114398 RepID=UPI001C728731|nr:uncharacterized protein LOC110282964 [Parasteatoda tepidariorum]
MKLQLKEFPTILLILFRFLISLECFIIPSSDVTYEDIKALNATCKGLDSCELPRRKNAHEHCNCDSSCSLLGTCCVDSKYRLSYVSPLKNVECALNIYDNKYHYVPMINSCDQDRVIYDRTIEKFCNSSAEELNDPFLKIPVTDPVTGISYKNYYCFACNENFGREEPIPWNLKIQSGCIHKEFNTTSIPPLRYDSYRKTWVMNYDGQIIMDVSLNTTIPEELKHVTPYCYNFRVITDCASTWADYSVEEKCAAYMALTRILSKDGFSVQYYRNPHCAICNYENIDDMVCLATEEVYDGEDTKTDVLSIKLFSLESAICTYSMVYDHFAKQCRNIYTRRKRFHQLG